MKMMAEKSLVSKHPFLKCLQGFPLLGRALNGALKISVNMW